MVAALWGKYEHSAVGGVEVGATIEGNTNGNAVVDDGLESSPANVEETKPKRPPPQQEEAQRDVLWDWEDVRLHFHMSKTRDLAICVDGSMVNKQVWTDILTILNNHLRARIFDNISPATSFTVTFRSFIKSEETC